MASSPYRRSNLVLIQQKGPSEDQSGWTNNDDWQTFTRAWVSVNPNRGREITKDGMTQSAVTHDIRGDWLDLKDVTGTMRIVFVEDGIYDPFPDDPRTFDILAVMRDDDFHEDVLIRAEEKKYGDGS